MRIIDFLKSLLVKDNKRKNTFFAQKCKQIYANKTENVDGVSILSSAYSFKNYIFKITECENADHFSDSSLRSYMRNSITDSIDGVAAYSVEKRTVKMRYHLLNSSDKSAALFSLIAVATDVFSKYDFRKMTVIMSGKYALVIKRCRAGITISKKQDSGKFFDF